MASLEKRNGHYRIVFMNRGEKLSFSLGQVDATDAEVSKVITEKLIRHYKQGILDLRGFTLVEYLRRFCEQGHPPDPEAPKAKEEGHTDYTLARLRDDYLQAAKGKLEDVTIMVARCHFRHLSRILEDRQPLEKLDRQHLQGYIDHRSTESLPSSKSDRKRKGKETLAKISAVTIRKEIKTLRTAWNWARHSKDLRIEWPGKHLFYPKSEASSPWMSIEEAERRAAAGDRPADLFDAIYLRPEEIAVLLDLVKTRPLPPWVWPLFVFAAHTGARRSEMLRVMAYDVNLEAGNVTLREKKRDTSRYTTRLVPLSPLLREVLIPMLNTSPTRPLFHKRDGGRLKPSLVQKYFHKALKGSRWEVLSGWHVFRHSFISAFASRGIDQRIIDDLVGHSTEEQRRRYRHLFPNVKERAMKDVFGDATDKRIDKKS